MGIAKNLQSENTRPINSVNFLIFYMTWGRKKEEILRKVLGQYQDYFLKLIALSFIKIIFDSNS
jgi:hypothetical protein